MKSFLAGLLVALVFISAGWAEHVEQTAPFALDSDNWYTFLDTYDQVLVLFNTPGDKGCQECQIAPSELNKLLESKPNCVLAQVDCSTQQTICQEHEVQNHLPAIKLFSSGIGVYDYPKRKVFVDTLARFVETYTVPKFVVISTIEELKDVIANNKVSAVGFFGNAVHDESIRGSFERTAAQLFLDMKFAVYELNKENANALDEYDLHPSDIAMFKTLGGHTSSITFDGPVSRRKLIRWIADNYPWLVTEITPERPFEKVAFGNVPILNMFLDYSDAESKEKYISEMEALIEEYKGRMTLTYKSTEGEDLHQFERYGYSAKKFPIVMLFDLARSKTYTFPESREINSETLKQFIDDFYDHKIQPHEVKEAIPEQPENAAVHIVVSDTFRKFIKNEDYDAVIFYYLPGKMCPHCIKFLEIYEELAETYSQNAGSEPTQIRFAKMNLDANERVPGRFIHNFPTIELFKRGEKNQEVLYSGPRTKEGLVHWLTTKSTTSVSASHFEKHGENSESEQKLDTKDLV